MEREFPAMEDELEVSLELSIGGCYTKSENNNLEREKRSRCEGEGEGNENENDVGAENRCELADLQKKREIQALKRREARMKREVKKWRGVNGEERESRERDWVTEESAPNPKREKINMSSLFGDNKAYGNGLPIGNGFARPWVVPLWVADGKSSADEPENVAAPPLVSHHRSTSTSHKGGSTSDSSSFCTHQNQCCSRSNTVEHSEVNNFSPQIEPDRCIGSTKVVLSSTQQPQSNTRETIKGSTTIIHAHTDNSCSTTDKPSSSPSPTSSVINKPPMLNVGSALHDMPCVSTTGNGPNGKTITGFLYKYTKSEVSIVCVCHGSLFSPAEFVEHAGGVGINHPLRYITVVPSVVK